MTTIKARNSQERRDLVLQLITTNMAIKAFLFVALAGLAQAIIVPSYGPSPYAPYAHAPVAAPYPYAHAPVVAKVAAPLGYAPHGYAAPAYAAPAYKVAAPVAYAAAPAYAKTVVDADYDPNPSYSYAYDIQDAITGDSKSQHESRQGDVVQGSYSLTEPDGTRRTVDYTADPVNGFNAVVHKQPLGVAVKAVAPAYAQPIAKYAAPLGYAAPYHG